VALNREVTQRARYAETRLSDGDKIEIVHPMGGGR
jgi:thiamine biosynthesis protein ThiS